MKPLKQYFKLISYLLSFLILLQGCSVYNRPSISLEQAVEKNYWVKLTTKSNKVTKFNYITKENGEYYGIEKRSKRYYGIDESNSIIKHQLIEEDIESLRLKNKWESIAATLFTLSLITISGIAINNDLAN